VGSNLGVGACAALANTFRTFNLNIQELDPKTAVDVAFHNPICPDYLFDLVIDEVVVRIDVSKR
jgi:hypothetical protein